MAAFTPVNTPGAYATAGQNTTPVASSAGADTFVMGSADILIAENSGASAHTVTVSSVVDPFNRTQDITAHSVPAGQWGIFGPFKPTGWRQSSGNLNIASNHAEIKWVILRIVF